MTVSIKSTTDSEATVTAALGNLEDKKPADDKKPEDKTGVTDPVTDEPVDKPTDEPEPSEPSEETEEPKEEDEEELEAKTEDETEKPKKKGGFQKKIAKQGQEIESLREQIQKLQTQKPADPTPTKDLTLRPKATDFATHDEYLEALVDWKADQKIQTLQAKRREDEIKTQIETKFNTYKERAIAFKESHDDFDEMVENIKISPAINEAVVESEVGPEIIYHLANDPKELARIRALPYGQAAREMGKLEVKFSKTAPKTSEKINASKPKPVTPVRTRGSGVVKDINDPNLSQQDFNRLRMEQIKQNSMRR